MSTRQQYGHSNRVKHSTFAKVPYMHQIKQQDSCMSTNHTPARTAYGTTMPSTHALVDTHTNHTLRAYEENTKRRFDTIATLVQQTNSIDVTALANNAVLNNSAYLPKAEVNTSLAEVSECAHRKIFAKTLFAEFLEMSAEFFTKDPLKGQDYAQTAKLFKDAGFHAVGMALCSDGRLAHLASYVLRIPYSFVRRKAHAGALFDVSESVRNWVFIEHNRYRDSLPNSASEATKYLQIAVYHYSSSAPQTQGCAAHGSSENDAALAALGRLKDLKQAIENRFGKETTLQTLLIGIDTDNDSLKIHVPNADGNVCVKRFLETLPLYTQTKNLDATTAKNVISNAIDDSNMSRNSSAPNMGIRTVVAWMVENNFSQIAYVEEFEQGTYTDIGHAERFIGIGNGFEEVQLRNLSYYGFLDTVEESSNDIDIGIKIFKELNVAHGLPIPIIIRCDFDGRVPGSKERAETKAQRINNAIHDRYKELSSSGYLETLITIRDYTAYTPVEVLAEERIAI